MGTSLSESSVQDLFVIEQNDIGDDGENGGEEEGEEGGDEQTSYTTIALLVVLTLNRSSSDSTAP